MSEECESYYQVIAIYYDEREIREFLEPCVRVVYGGKSYRIVLGKIIEVWKQKDQGNREEGVCFYHLRNALIDDKRNNRDNVVVGDSSIINALKVLSECGYLAVRKAKNSRNTPWGRKDYAPTPLGIAMNLILNLLYPEEAKASELYRNDYTYLELGFSVRELFFNNLPYIMNLTIERISPQPSQIPNIIKGYLTAEHAAYSVVMKLSIKAVRSFIEAKPEIALNNIPGITSEAFFIQSPLLMILQSGICREREKLKALKENEIKKELEELNKIYEWIYKSLGLKLSIGEEEKKAISQAVEYIYNYVDVFCK